MTVRLATGADRAAVAAMLARAFQDDPVFSWIIPDPAVRARRLPRLFRLLYTSDGRAGLRLMSDDGAAVGLWRAPGRAKVGWGEMLAQALPILAALGTGVPRGLAASGAIDAHMPAGAFWYLHILGCEPAMQGRGLGGAVLRAGLARAAGRLPCYLETALERNIGLYAAAGFRVSGEWRIGTDGPRLWSMLRPADRG